MTDEDRSLGEDLSWACRLLALEGYQDLTLGHVSARGPEPGQIYIKRKGVAFEEVAPRHILVFDLADERALDAPEMHLESVLHTEVYKRRPDVRAVIHGHPPHATAFGATDSSVEMLTHDHVLFAEGIAFFDNAPHLITRPEQGKEVAEALGDQDVVMLRNHGVLVVGKSLRWAVLRAITLERAIQLQAIASSLGPLRPFPGALAKEIRNEKYQDHFVDEYWEAWIRQLQHGGHDHGMKEV